jgi:TM2 domain-containing membrane protein YozV
MNFMRDIFWPSLFLSIVSNVMQQILLLITGWTIRMALLQWILFALTCWVGQFLAFFIMLRIRYWKQEDYNHRHRNPN